MWKSQIIMIAILFAVAITSAGCNSKQTKVLNVKDVETNPLTTKDSVTILGIVASVSNNPKEFTLMDVADARSNKPARDTFYLRILSKKRAPNVGEAVKVTGQLMEHGSYVFATTVKRWKLRPV